MKREIPEVSVVIAASENTARLHETLAALGTQNGIDRAELVIAYGGDDGDDVDGGIGIHELPRVRVLRLAGETLPGLKAAGLRAAGSELVAILDPWDVPDPGWLRAVRDAFRDPSVTVIAGAVALDERATAAERAAYLFDLGAFAPPVAPGPTNGDLPGTNICYRSSVLEETCADILKTGYFKPLLHDRLRAAGKSLHLAGPEMGVRHLWPQRLTTFLLRRFHHGRCFGAMRAADATVARRLLYVLSAPLVPALLAVRHIRRAWSRPDGRSLLHGCALHLIAVCAAWGLGEWVGCWLGRGRSCEQVY